MSTAAIHYKILINDRNYSSWIIQEVDTCIPADNTDIHPITYKMFSKDVFIIQDNKPVLIHSYVRTTTILAGILILTDNKTYGRTKNGRLLYKCIPDNKHLPVFYVPYDIKIGFSKKMSNKYIVFTFDSWESKNPIGKITETLGDINRLDAFYEYQLYCSSLHESLTEFSKETRKIYNQLNKGNVSGHSNDEYIQTIRDTYGDDIEDRTKEHVFSIDPKNCTDIDDAFSVKRVRTPPARGCLDADEFYEVERGVLHTNITPSAITSSTEEPPTELYCVSVYIANVFLWIEMMGLWKSFSRRVSTIYLPDRKRPMLPTILSENLCSLLANQTRLAFVMDVYIDNSGAIQNIKYKNAFIRVASNYEYDTTELFNDPHYQTLFQLTQQLDNKVTDSHDMVEYWMIQMNKYVGEKMYHNNTGIYRITTGSLNTVASQSIATSLDPNLRNIINTWNHLSSNYVYYDGANASTEDGEETDGLQHQVMNVRSYVHITSPIRRLVDLLNQMIFIRAFGMLRVRKLSVEAQEFMEKWIHEMDYINMSMRSIRKIQIDCAMMDRCFHDEELMQRSLTGFVFDKVAKNEGLKGYMVYLTELKMLFRFNTYMDIDNYTEHRFKLFFFGEEHHPKRKVRLGIVSSNQQ